MLDSVPVGLRPVAIVIGITKDCLGSHDLPGDSSTRACVPTRQSDWLCFRFATVSELPTLDSYKHGIVLKPVHEWLARLGAHDLLYVLRADDEEEGDGGGGE